MSTSRAGLVQTALRCYPARWRHRHGEEAAELAALLIRDGSPVGSIAWNYFLGAAREWVTPRPGRRLRMAACALVAVACSLGISAGLVTSSAPARAASTSGGHGYVRCSAGAAPYGIPVQIRARVIIGDAGHDRSC